MRVHHVEALALVAAAQAARSASQREGAGWELVQLHAHPVERSQRVHLVAHEASALGMSVVGEHVGYHERAHSC